MSPTGPSTGFASAAVLGATDIGAVDVTGQSSPIQLAAGLLPDGSTGRIVLITVMACVVFLAVLTTVTSVTFAAAVSFAHDVFGRGKRYRTHTGEVRALRVAAVIVCAVGLSLATAIHDSGGSAALPRPKILNSTFGTWNTES